MSQTVSMPAPAVQPAQPVAADSLHDSFRLPVLALFIGAGCWLVVSSLLALIASIKFHGPGFLADTAWLTYGRVRPAATTALVYGFCIPAGMGVMTWILGRLGRVKLALPVLVLGGTLVWNLGLVLGVGGILNGDASGFPGLEIPRYAVPMLFMGYSLLGIAALLTFHRRVERTLFVSHWFFVAAIFWFPWVFSTAGLLLLGNPVRGVAQPVIAWWYAANVNLVWMSLVGLGAAFYLIARVTGRELQSRYLGLFAFWVILLVASWTGIPKTAPVPAWLPALSTVTGVMLVLLPITVLVMVHQTLDGKCSLLWASLSTRFVRVGVMAFVLSGVMWVLLYAPRVSGWVEFTWFQSAESQLRVFGFFTMVMFGAIYYILPQIVGADARSGALARTHFWLATVGILLAALPLAVGGFIEGSKLQNPNIAFVDVAKSTLHFLRISTIGDLLILAGNLLLLLNLMGLTVSFYRTKATVALRGALAEDAPAGVKA
jgi:cytochrome c oxidase cbb3-type subunit 1